MKVCAEDGCDGKHVARGYCRRHYNLYRSAGAFECRKYPRYDPVCSVEGCQEKHRTNGYCRLHYMRVWAAGRPGPASTTRRHRPERTVCKRDGYARVRMPEHPRADKAGMVLEHIPVLEAVIGRYIDWRAGEQVHHVNGVKDDNRPENLELWVTSQPPGQRPADLVKWARDILARYADEVDPAL